MWLRVWRHELRSLWADRTLLIVLGVFAVAIAYGTFNGLRWVRFQQAAIAQALAEESDRYRKHEADIVRINRDNVSVSAFADPRNPEAVGRGLGARYAVLPPTPLGLLAIGQSDLLPYYLRMTTDAKQTVLAATELENPQRLLIGRFDLAFVLVYLYPLLILAITYNTLSAERENGTLVLALSQPVSLRTLLAGKLTVRFMMFVAIVVVFALVALLAVRVDLTAAGAATRLLLWTAAVAAYGLFWFSVAVAVIAAGRPSVTNAMALAGCWLVVVLILPALLNLLTTTLYPVPSRVQMIQAMREASDEANSKGSQLLAQYYEDHPELATGDAEQAMNDFNLVRVAVDDEVERRVTPVLEGYERQLSRQQAIVASARFLSPAILMQEALNDIAGTGAARHESFLDQVGAYHSQWRQYFVSMIFSASKLEDFSGVPRFTYREESAAGVTARVLPCLAGLLVLSLICGAWGAMRLPKYPIVG